jgi:hypothetical protein
VKVTLELRDGTMLAVEQPRYEGATAVEAAGACPYCARTPFMVAGSGRRLDPDHSHDTWLADAGCLACKAWVGYLRAKVSTLFGIEEDERVLRGACKVY